MTKNIRGENKYNKVGNTTLNISASYCRVRGRSREDPMPKRRQPRGATQRPGQGWRPGGATPRPRPGAAAERNNPTSKEWWLRRRSRAQRSYSTFKVRRGGGEEIPLVQGKRNSSKMVGVARGHQRADTLNPYSQKTSQSNHTRTTALNETKPCPWGNPRRAGHGGEI